jgi:hypothetical protein
MVWKSGLSGVLIFATIAVEYYQEEKSLQFTAQQGKELL